MKTIKHKIVISRKYNVFAVNGDGSTNLIETIESPTRPRETELCKEHNVKKVVIFEIKEDRKTKTYEMDEAFFIEHATEITE